jgi:LPS O-antigen subunit length determinant protein (WzzB/FepE family)
LAKLKATVQISNFDDIVEKYSERVIQPAIDQLEKLEFYQDHLNMLDLRCNRRQDEVIKRFEASLANSPIGYYWGVHTELSPEILSIGDHMKWLKTKLAAINYNTTDLHALVICS